MIFGIMASVIPIAFLPFLTKRLEASDFGLITSFNIAAMILGNLIRLDLNNSLKRFYPKEFYDFGRFSTGSFASSFTAFVGVSLLIGALSLVGVKELLDLPIEWLFFAGILAFFRSQIMNLHHLWQIRNQSIRYGVWSLASIILVYSIFSILIVSGDASWRSRIVGEVAVAAVGFLIAVYFLYKSYGLFAKTDLTTVRLLLGFSMPIVPGSLLSYYFITSDRIFISELFSSSQLGLYSLAFQISSVLEIFFRAVSPVWESWLFQDRGRGVSENLRGAILNIIVSMLVFLIIMGLISPFFIGFFAEFLIDAKVGNVNKYLAPCVFAILAAGFYRFTVPLSLMIKKTKNITYCTVMMLFLNVPVMLALTHFFGVVGAGVGVGITFLVGALLQIFLFLNCSRRMC